MFFEHQQQATLQSFKSSTNRHPKVRPQGKVLSVGLSTFL